MTAQQKQKEEFLAIQTFEEYKKREQQTKEYKIKKY